MFLLLKTVVFHCYVSLVEGNQDSFSLLTRSFFSPLPSAHLVGLVTHLSAKKRPWKNRLTNKKGASPEDISTLQGINISHLGKRKIIFKMAFLGGYVSFLEGKSFPCFVGEKKTAHGYSWLVELFWIFFFGGEGWGKSVLTIYLPKNISPRVVSGAHRTTTQSEPMYHRTQC